jgi:hypothetical protein
MVKEAWVGHPQRLIIPHSDDFLHKIQTAKEAIEQILAGKSWKSIIRFLNKNDSHQLS